MSIGAALLAVTASASDGATAVPEGAEIKDFQIVPCLLPARVRKLGNMVYPERRVLTSTTASRCELRGGEYTFYDRAAPEGSVAFFKPLAEAGDPHAQVSLGEVYEYLFEEPRYADAAIWYQKAADQEDSTGLRRLAHLYEKGLGVPADAVLAANLWRKAIGTDENLVLASELEKAKTAADRRIAEVTEQLRARNAETEELRLALASAQKDVDRRRAELVAARGQVASLKKEVESIGAAQNADPARLEALTRELAERERLIEDQRYQIASMEADIAAQDARLTATAKQAELENQKLRAELTRATSTTDQALAQARGDLDAKSTELATLTKQQSDDAAALGAQRARVDALANELAALRAKASVSDTQTAERIAALEAERRTQAELLASSQKKADALNAKLASMQTEVARLTAALDAAVHENERAEAQRASTDAELLAARDGLERTERELAAMRDALAEVRTERDELKASLQSANVGGAELARLQKELATRDQKIAFTEGRLKEAATSRDELKAELEQLRQKRNLELATRGKFDPLPDTSKVAWPQGVKAGKGYAIVIGNNNYQSSEWRDLNFAAADAQRVHEVLSHGYGFDSKLMLDATRGEILSAFADLGDKMRAEDRLVVYYAGHGVRRKNESYWIGVDAVDDRKSLPISAVSTFELNRWLSALTARQVIVISDSCYVGPGIETTGGMMYTSKDVDQTLRFYLSGRSRTSISSGGDAPVPDGDGGGGSSFTKEFVTLLNENHGVLFADDLFERLKQRVEYARAGAPLPVFARLETGGHGSGQFVFVRPSIVPS